MAEVGAAGGRQTAEFAAHLGRRGYITAFEANPVLAAAACVHIAACSNACVIHAHVGRASSGTETLDIPTRYQLDVLRADETSPSQGSLRVDVPATSLDAWFRRRQPRPSCIVVAGQAAGAVLDGSQTTIERDRPSFVFRGSLLPDSLILERLTASDYVVSDGREYGQPSRHDGMPTRVGDTIVCVPRERRSARRWNRPPALEERFSLELVCSRPVGRMVRLASPFFYLPGGRWLLRLRLGLPGTAAVRLRVEGDQGDVLCLERALVSSDSGGAPHTMVLDHAAARAVRLVVSPCHSGSAPQGGTMTVTEVCFR
jgi:hypothetical protein